MCYVNYKIKHNLHKYFYRILNINKVKQYYLHCIKCLDVLSQASWARRSEASTRSHISDRASLISSVPGGPDDDVRLTPQQYGVLGESYEIYY